MRLIDRMRRSRDGRPIVVVLIGLAAVAIGFLLSGCNSTRVVTKLDPATQKPVAVELHTTNFITNRNVNYRRDKDGVIDFNYGNMPNENIAGVLVDKVPSVPELTEMLRAARPGVSVAPTAATGLPPVYGSPQYKAHVRRMRIDMLLHSKNKALRGKLNTL